jgi:hypothetical protein
MQVLLIGSPISQEMTSRVIRSPSDPFHHIAVERLQPADDIPG